MTITMPSEEGFEQGIAAVNKVLKDNVVNQTMINNIKSFVQLSSMKNMYSPSRYPNLELLWKICHPESIECQQWVRNECWQDLNLPEPEKRVERQEGAPEDLPDSGRLIQYAQELRTKFNNHIKSQPEQTQQKCCRMM